MTGRNPVRIVLAPRPARHGDVLTHHRAHHLQPDSDCHRQQTFAHIGDHLADRHRHRGRRAERGRGSIDRLEVVFHERSPSWSGVLADAQHLPEGRRQVGTRHLKFDVGSQVHP
jgi:hypothetical protein